MNDNDMQLLILGALLDYGALPYGTPVTRDDLLAWVPLAEDDLDFNIRALEALGFVTAEKDAAGRPSRVRLSQAGFLFVTAFRPRSS